LGFEETSDRSLQLKKQQMFGLNFFENCDFFGKMSPSKLKLRPAAAHTHIHMHLFLQIFLWAAPAIHGR
jgi:hypothetical protein